MDLIVETDLGHDPDDFFALCYLACAGVDIKAIVIVPGDPDQVAIARLFCREVGLDVPVGASKLNRERRSSGGIHHRLLERYGCAFDSRPDGIGWEIIRSVSDRDTEFLIIGPATSVGRFFAETGSSVARATMQGGFVSYGIHAPAVRLEKFEGRDWQPTFNLNGDRHGADAFLAADVGRRQFVSKNVCHTVVYDRDRYDAMDWGDSAPGRLFREGMGMYLETHDGKKFHDPTAAVCHLHPEVATWTRGRMARMGSGWGAAADPDGDHLIVDIDRERLWAHVSALR